MVKKDSVPYFSICIPQFNRTSFLLEALDVLVGQTFRDFEVCISDDASTDEREDELLDFLRNTRLSYRYQRQKANVRYDANLRSAIALAGGRYSFLLGNDDCLAAADTLEVLHEAIADAGPIDLTITNYADFATGHVYRRMPETRVVTGGVNAAVEFFRSLSFVSGVVFRTQPAQSFATDRWDGSEMYQMGIGVRMLATGGRLLCFDRVTVRKGLRIEGEEVDSYETRDREDVDALIERDLPMRRIPTVVMEGLASSLDPEQRRAAGEAVTKQVILYTYPYWLFEYRRSHGWTYAAGVALGMRPNRITPEAGLSVWARTRLRLIYAVVTLGGLIVPLSWFQRLYPSLYRIAKRARGRSVPADALRAPQADEPVR